MSRPSINHINGKNVLSVEQCYLFRHELPPVNSFDYNNCNGFIVYRSILHKELRGFGTEEISGIASETWHIAKEDFRIFFNDYARKINQAAKKKFSTFKQYEVKPIKRKNKTLSKYPYVKQEVVTKKVYEKEVEDFEFVSF
ncbi:hypothetical protein C1646_766581 [Rhizophagus diaphanus]|nr:hypothetical protein C1646_766581 [Rhizophagus diaphanus] [Rhizophagus sp. MUCL 43196]